MSGKALHGKVSGYDTLAKVRNYILFGRLHCVCVDKEMNGLDSSCVGGIDLIKPLEHKLWCVLKKQQLSSCCFDIIN